MPRWRPIGCSNKQLFLEDGNECALRAIGRCAVPAEIETVIGENLPQALSLDHIREQAHHGSDHRPVNLLTMHRHCNRIRGDRPFVQFVGPQNARRIAQLFPRVAPTIIACLGG